MKLDSYGKVTGECNVIPKTGLLSSIPAVQLSVSTSHRVQTPPKVPPVLKAAPTIAPAKPLRNWAEFNLTTGDGGLGWSFTLPQSGNPKKQEKIPYQGYESLCS